jgi:hypothetical protein
MSEEQKVEAQGIIPAKLVEEETIQDESLPVVQEVIVKQPTKELKVQIKTVIEEAKESVEKLIKENSIETYTEEEYNKWIEQARQYIVQHRVEYAQILYAAKVQLKDLHYHHVRVSQMATICGLRKNHIITLGRFAYMRSGGWLFEPSNDQVISIVARFQTKAQAIQKAKKLWAELEKTTSIAEEEVDVPLPPDALEGTVPEKVKRKKIVGEDWKDDLLEQIEAELLTTRID